MFALGGIGVWQGAKCAKRKSGIGKVMLDFVKNVIEKDRKNIVKNTIKGGVDAL